MFNKAAKHIFNRHFVNKKDRIVLKFKKKNRTKKMGQYWLVLRKYLFAVIRFSVWNTFDFTTTMKYLFWNMNENVTMSFHTTKKWAIKFCDYVYALFDNAENCISFNFRTAHDRIVKFQIHFRWIHKNRWNGENHSLNTMENDCAIAWIQWNANA